MSHQLGDRVRVAPSYRFYADWADWCGFVTGMQIVARTGAVTIDVSDSFPPQSEGDFTHGFAPDELVAAA